jgi:GR25 family glycosyltransferase involved in LPS biosynthesis
MTAGEIAVYASHRRALRDFLDSGAEFGLILEDDFAFVDPLATPGRIAALLAVPLRWDIIKLYDYGPGRGVVQRAAAGDISVVNYTAPTAGMVAYLATRRGAERLLSRPSLFRQIDEDTKYYWELAIRVYSASPNPVREISDQLGGSILAAEREALRGQRSLRRSLKGLFLTIDRKLRHRWHRRRFRLRPR